METRHAEHGCLFIIGGDEGAKARKRLLSRFVDLAGGSDKRFLLIDAASQTPEKMARPYHEALDELGVRDHRSLAVCCRADANDADIAAQAAEADGILMTGGDQKRLLAAIGGTALDQAIHAALKERGACIAGTSAGASAMSGHMLGGGHVELSPERGAVTLAAGLGLVQQVVIDQHFAQRQRLNRLLSVIAQNPWLQGAGIDENTALVVERGVGIEVVGEGSVTLVDGKDVISDIADIREGCTPQMLGVRLHLLPAGSCFMLPDAPAPRRISGDARKAPAVLTEFIHHLVKRNPIS
jgi:cyanophycinase